MNQFSSILDSLKSTDTIKEMLKKYDQSEDVLDLVPIFWDKNLEVSARTTHGLIAINAKLKNQEDEVCHYLAHELEHYFQQTCGDKPTQGADTGDYLENPYEIEGFQTQTKFISETEGDHEAEKYIEKVLDHHDVSDDQFENKKNDLLRLAKTPEQLDLPFKYNTKIEEQVTKQERDKFIDDLSSGNIKPKYRYNSIEKFPDFEKRYRLQKLKEILQLFNDDKIEKQAGTLKVPQDFPVKEIEKFVLKFLVARTKQEIEEKIELIKDQKFLKKQLNLMEESERNITSFFFEDAKDLGSVEVVWNFNSKIKKLTVNFNDNYYSVQLNGMKWENLTEELIENLLWNKFNGILSVEIETIKEKIEELQSTLSIEKDLDKFLIYLNNLPNSFIDEYKLNYKEFDLTINLNTVESTANNSDAGVFEAVSNNTAKINLLINPYDINSKSDFNNYFENIIITLNHELIHFVQYIREVSGKVTNKQKYFGVENFKENENQNEEHTLSKNIDEESSYYLDSAEFDTQLYECIMNMKYYFKNTSKSFQNELFQYMTEDKYNEKYNEYVDNTFFKTLKKYSPKRWKLAVKELYKNLYE